MRSCGSPISSARSADRSALYFGPDFDLAALKPDLPHLLAQLRAQFAWMDQRIGAGRDFMLGAEPGLPDALCYYLVWFIRGRYDQGPQFLAQLTAALMANGFLVFIERVNNPFTDQQVVFPLYYCILDDLRYY